MDSARTLLASVVENDVAAHRICKELKAHDFDALDRCPVDFDWQDDLASTDACIEDTDVLRRLLGPRTGM